MRAPNPQSNIAYQIKQWATKTPEKIALNLPVRKRFKDQYDYRGITFEDFDQKTDYFAQGLKNHGITKGSKVLVFLKPGEEFAVSVFGLFKVGATAVFIDPGMGRKNLLNAVEEVKPQALIGVPLTHLLTKLKSSHFQSLKIKITSGKRALLSDLTYQTVLKSGKSTLVNQNFSLTEMTDDDIGAILFTSGGTGKPKGVIYTHSIFIAQTQMLQKMFMLTNSDRDIPGFPLFSFFTMAMGMTSTPPDMNPSRPSKCRPARIIQNIQDNQATFAAGSPAIWERVANYALKKNIKLESLKYLVMFGAPVPLSLHEKLLKILPNGDTYTPYGATESLPITLAQGSHILEETAQKTLEGQGTCIGKVIDNVEVQIIDKNADDHLTDISQVSFLKKNEIGEIIVKSSTTTQSYYQLPIETKNCKILDPKNPNQKWHRMGDLGYLDDNDLLWFCGRKAHTVSLMLNGELKDFYSICIEVFFNQIQGVKKSALIQIEKQKSIGIVLEFEDQKNINKGQVIDDIKKIQQTVHQASFIDQFYECPSLPVDVRHNIKIDRKKLEIWVKEGLLPLFYKKS